MDSAAAPSHPIGPRKVLIVDDNQDAAETLALVLEHFGFDTKTAYDGSQALAVAREWNPAAVILDLNMPVMDGIEAAQRLRASDPMKRTVLVALTANVFPVVRAGAMAAGFDLFLQKPTDALEVASLVGRALSSR